MKNKPPLYQDDLPYRYAHDSWIVYIHKYNKNLHLNHWCKYKDGGNDMVLEDIRELLWRQCKTCKETFDFIEAMKVIAFFQENEQNEANR